MAGILQVGRNDDHDRRYGMKGEIMNCWRKNKGRAKSKALAEAAASETA